MTEIKLIAPKIVFDCEFAEISRDNKKATLSLSLIFTPDELEKLDCDGRLVFWSLCQGQSIRVSIQRTEQ